MARRDRLTVAVTGPTGTFGFALMPVLERERRVESVVGVARRPFDPAVHGWDKLTYRQGDVRDPAVLEEAFAGADVVVHLAFIITGTSSRETTSEINLTGTRNAFRAAVAAGARRFVYASSVAAYGFHDDNPVGMDEQWPTRPADHLFYAREKAELEGALTREAEDHPELDLYLLRPPVVVGPHAVGAKSRWLQGLVPFLQRTSSAMHRLPVTLPLPVADVPMQLIHEDDVADAILRCVLGDGPPGAYNITGPGVVSMADVVRELGFRPVRVPAGPFGKVASAVAGLPVPSFLPPVWEWAEAVSHPAVMDASKAERELGWRPRYSSLEALRSLMGTGADRLVG